MLAQYVATLNERSAFRRGGCSGVLIKSSKSFKVQKANSIDENASRKFKRRTSVLGRKRSFCFELDILMLKDFVLQMFNFPHLSIHEEDLTSH